MKKLVCRGLDDDNCCFEVSGEDEQEIIDKMMRHARMCHTKMVKSTSEHILEQMMKRRMQDDVGY